MFFLLFVLDCFRFGIVVAGAAVVVVSVVVVEAAVALPAFEEDEVEDCLLRLGGIFVLHKIVWSGRAN